MKKFGLERSKKEAQGVVDLTADKFDCSYGLHIYIYLNPKKTYIIYLFIDLFTIITHQGVGLKAQGFEIKAQGFEFRGFLCL